MSVSEALAVQGLVLFFLVAAPAFGLIGTERAAVRVILLIALAVLLIASASSFIAAGWAGVA